MSIDVVVPPLGESITGGVLAVWLSRVGATVAANQPIAEIETSKVTTEVLSPVAGVLTEELVAAGTRIKVGDVIARVEASGS